MSVVLRVGSYYYNNSQRSLSLMQLNKIEIYSSSSYLLHFGNYRHPINVIDMTDIKYEGNSSTILEITLKTNQFTELTGPKTVKFEGPSFLDPIWIEATYDGENWVEFKTSSGPKVEFESNPACLHEWVTTVGFSSNYTDCKLCGVKKEEV